MKIGDVSVERHGSIHARGDAGSLDVEGGVGSPGKVLPGQLRGVAAVFVWEFGQHVVTLHLTVGGEGGVVQAVLTSCQLGELRLCVAQLVWDVLHRRLIEWA